MKFQKENIEILAQTVFPSEEKTVAAFDIDDTYGGAHKYGIIKSLGFSNGKADYCPPFMADSIQMIQFVRKNEDGSMTPGVQSEQLVIVILDRLKKLNAKFPAPENELQIKGLEDYLKGCELRITNRMERGVMGDLKK